MSGASIRWRGGTLAFASAHGDVVRVTPAARLAEGAGCWTAEELIAGAAAASYALAVVEAAERDDLPLIDATLETLEGYENAVREMAAAQRAAWTPDAH